MKTVNWNPEKARLIKQTRDIDFDRIAVMIEEREILGVYDVPSRPGQRIFVIDYDDYLVCVPFVENENEIFIKAAYKSRKLTKAEKGRK